MFYQPSSRRWRIFWSSCSCEILLPSRNSSSTFFKLLFVWKVDNCKLWTREWQFCFVVFSQEWGVLFSILSRNSRGDHVCLRSLVSSTTSLNTACFRTVSSTYTSFTSSVFFRFSSVETSFYESHLSEKDPQKFITFLPKKNFWSHSPFQFVFHLPGSNGFEN
jgi:hypothetical protein